MIEGSTTALRDGGTGYLGVLGGMGPLATTDFMIKLLNATPARWDQEHVPAIIRSVPQIPDRSAFILGTGPSPLEHLAAGVQQLVRSGAARIAIPCNTAHFWHEELSRLSPVPIFHIVESVADHLQDRTPRAALGLLATEGTYRAGIYQRRLSERGHDVILPQPERIARLITPGIHAVKAGNLSAGLTLLADAADGLFDRGAERVIMACTEIPVVLTPETYPRYRDLVDATSALARSCAAWWADARARSLPLNHTNTIAPDSEDQIDGR
jgi:aspartate racemase